LSERKMRLRYGLFVSSTATVRRKELCALRAVYGDLSEALEGEKGYRVRQVRDWIYERGITNFDEMTNLPLALRQKLARDVPEFALELLEERVSVDGTVKRAYRGGSSSAFVIESVLMRYDDGRNTACLSSQAGCAMGCVFCATGQMGFQKQLSALEIFEQACRFDAELKKQDTDSRGGGLNRVVMMGMGEPLLNFDAVSEAIDRIQSDLGIGARRITVSTVGVVPNILKFGERHPQCNLAISLHAANDQERSKLLPANQRYGGLDVLMETARDYWRMTNRQVTFEWALPHHDDVNDVTRKATELGLLLGRYGLYGPASHVNVIPLNPTKGFKGVCLPASGGRASGVGLLSSAGEKKGKVCFFSFQKKM